MHWRDVARSRFADHPEVQTTRDPLMVPYWERVLHGLVVELVFPEEVHTCPRRGFGRQAA
jgi:hypothetical protein